MLKLTLINGEPIWLNVLAIRCVTPSGLGEPGQCEVFTDATTRYTVKGKPEVIANDILGAMRIIHRGS